MSNPWFRFYHEFSTDPKVQMLSEQDQRRYIMLLCLRCSNDDVTLQDDQVAFQLRVSNEEYATTKMTLIGAGLIDDSNQPTAWDKRQFSSDSSAARVARHRAAKKRPCNVTETKCNAIESDTDTDTDTDKRLASKPVETDQPAAKAIKPRAQKPDAFKSLFAKYPAHRKGGTDQTAWKKWKSEKLTDDDAGRALAWLESAAGSDPDWRTDAGGKFVMGITKFIGEQHWLTPVPRPRIQPAQISKQAALEERNARAAADFAGVPYIGEPYLAEVS